MIYIYIFIYIYIYIYACVCIHIYICICTLAAAFEDPSRPARVPWACWGFGTELRSATQDAPQTGVDENPGAQEPTYRGVPKKTARGLNVDPKY